MNPHDPTIVQPHEADCERQTCENEETNEAIHAIITEAREKLRKLDAPLFCMIPSYDFEDIDGFLLDLLPDLSEPMRTIARDSIYNR